MTETKTEVPAVYASLAEVMKGLSNVPRNGKMKFGSTSYDYLKADDVQEKLNPLLIENNIIVQSQYGTRDVEKGSRDWVYVDLRLTYISTLDGSQMSVNATGESIAGDDKAVNRALTQAIKNCHRATFQFASGEPEPDDIAPGTSAPAKAAPAALKNAKKAPAKAQSEVIGGNSVALIKSEFTENKDSKVTGDDVKALADKIKKDKDVTGEALWSEVLRSLRTGAKDTK